VPKEWDIGRDKVEGERCQAHPVVIHLISLELAMEREQDAFKVGLLPLEPLPSCNDIEQPVFLVLCGLVKEVRQVEFEVVSVSKKQCPGTFQQFCSDTTSSRKEHAKGTVGESFQNANCSAILNLQSFTH